MVASGSRAFFLEAFPALAGRGPWLVTAAGDDELLTDMPYMLLILAVL
jgi:hypothetical protein